MINTQESQIQQAIEEARLGKKESARKILSKVVKQTPDDARVWYLLSQVVEKPEQAIYCLERVLKLQPDNEQVRERILKLQGDLKFETAIEKPAIVASEIPPKEEPSIATKKEILPISTDKTKKCPYCAEIIKEEATVCKYCGRKLPKPGKKRAILIATCIFVVIIVLCCFSAYQKYGDPFEKVSELSISICEASIGYYLPSSSSFESIDNSQLTIEGDKYIVEGYVNYYFKGNKNRMKYNCYLDEKTHIYVDKIEL